MFCVLLKWCHDTQNNDTYHNGTQASCDYHNNNTHLDVMLSVTLVIVMTSVRILSVLLMLISILSVIMPSAIMLSVLLLTVIILSVDMLTVVMLSVVMQRVVMQSVVAPLRSFH
jgi:hypothetical protein